MNAFHWVTGILNLGQFLINITKIKQIVCLLAQDWALLPWNDKANTLEEVIPNAATKWAIMILPKLPMAKPTPEMGAHTSSRQLHWTLDQGLSYKTTWSCEPSYLGIKPRDHFWTWELSNRQLFMALQVVTWIFQLMLFTVPTKAPFCQ